jgi:hypothetical protein
MAYNAYVAIDGSDRDINHEMLKTVLSEINSIRSLQAAIKDGSQFNDTVQIRSFNDGNNIFDEYVTVNICFGEAVLRFYNTSYMQSGHLITKHNVKDYQEVFNTVVDNYKFGTVNGSIDLMIALLAGFTSEK